MTEPSDTRRGLSRRDLFIGAGAAVGASAITAAGASVVAGNVAAANSTAVGSSVEPFFGEHQSGIATASQAHGVFAAFTLNSTANRDTIRGVLKVATIEASRLCSGIAGMSDTDPTIADLPARLTITFGFGHGLFEAAGMAARKPAGFIALPAFAIDQLQPEFSGGDLLIQIGSDDPMTLSHALRHMTRVVSSIAEPLYSQRGFVRAAGSTAPGETHRNLMGFKDGTENPRSDADFADQVWLGSNAGWCAGGTLLVLRRIAMDLPKWDLLGVTDKEAAFGRRMDSGAPLTGTDEFDKPDFAATNALGLPIITEYAHMARAHVDDPSVRFLRRPLNYDDGIRDDGSPDSGLLFAAYTTDIEKRFLPVQQRLAELDILNVWTTPIGSSEFVIPPGVAEGGYIGQSLFES